jgi:hypothetical protein
MTTKLFSDPHIVKVMEIEEKLEKDVYRAIDSFLIEAKDQNGKERSLERLNADRHLAAKNLMAIADDYAQAKIDQIFKDEVEKREKMVREKGVRVR